ncbi:hypothetical protein KGA66_22825 [Actinocrinis puniceicyclus]|uniref:Uncharacterized protein n=1 Tax=Actinocrinis puniceicyclus TaxID=977794 RepID=A0A8J8BF77_9ACTN|nr:hypothetical protein [Actinocrinis puniceicyclus]MBS2965901.1 hypothetical protein [Actinocrinis puniceicyclus]
MAGLRELLLRFRRAGAPGAATVGAVPADRAAEQAAELAPVFAALAETEAQAAEIRSRAAAEAAQLRQQAARQAALIVAQARENAVAERESAARRARSQAETYCAQLLQEARTQAESLRSRGQASVPEYGERVVAGIAARLRSESGPSAQEAR